PAVSGASPKAVDSEGTIAIIRVPKRTTRPIAAATSSFFDFRVDSTPATAAAPQMPKPQPMSTARSLSTLNTRARPSPETLPTVTMAAARTRTSQPRSRMSPSTTCAPSATMPSRSRGLAAKLSPGGEGLGQIRNEVAEQDAQDDRHQKRREDGLDHGDRPGDGRRRGGDPEAGEQRDDAIHDFSLTMCAHRQ